MKLMQFLNAGNRVGDDKPTIGRYQLPKGPALPKFESKKNPFGASKSAEEVQSNPAPTVPEKSAVPASESLAASEEAADSRSDPAGQPKKPGVFARLFRRQAKPKVKKPAAKREGGLFSRRKKAAAGSAHAPVQGELSLDNVQVVRNDLSDSDFDVVCATTATASPVAKRHSPNADSGRPGLGRIAEKLFGSDNQ